MRASGYKRTFKSNHVAATGAGALNRPAAPILILGGAL